MARRAVVEIILAALLLIAALVVVLTFAQAQASPGQNASSSSVQPNAGAVIGGPNSTLATRPPELQCQGCHGAGKQLPYMAGSLFHTDPHNGYDHSFHAQAKQSGAKAAACLDCHTRNGDMTTILPASDPKSSINRANIAETCGRCHGDKTVMEGSGI